MEYMHFRWWFKLICFSKMFTNCSSSSIAGTIETLLGFWWRHFGSHRDVLKHFHFLKSIIGISSKTFICSLSNVKRRWILDKICQSFEKNRIIGNIKHQLILMLFFALIVQKLCYPIFPNLQDLLSHKLVIVTTAFYPKSLHLLSRNWFLE